MLKSQRISTQSGFAHILLTLIIVVTFIAAVVGAVFVYSKVHGFAPSAAAKTAKFVSAAPLDFEQMQAISKFRSCAGHDYSGKDIDGVVETERSMKHYAAPLKSLETTAGQIKLFAPFDGVVVNNSPGKLGDNVDLSPTAAPGYLYELGHIQSVKSLTTGSHIKAGQLIGSFTTEGGLHAFDLQFWYGDKTTVNTLNGYFDSLFAHMTPDLAAKLEPYGLTADNLIVTKAYRDAHPCHGTTKQLDSTIFDGDYAQDYIQIKNAANPTGANLSKASSGDSSSQSGSNAGPSTSGDNHAAECTVPIAQRPPGCANH